LAKAEALSEVEGAKSCAVLGGVTTMVFFVLRRLAEALEKSG
jgi:hypothetical protein